MNNKPASIMDRHSHVGFNKTKRSRIQSTLEIPKLKEPETAKSLIIRYRSEILKKLMLSLKNEEYSRESKDLTDKLNKINELLLNKRVLALISELLKEKKTNTKKVSVIEEDKHLKSKHIKLKKEMENYSFNGEIFIIKQILSRLNDAVSDSNVLKLNVLFETFEKKLEQYIFMSLLKVLFNSKNRLSIGIKKSKMKEMKKELDLVIALKTVNVHSFIEDEDILSRCKTIALSHKNIETLNNLNFYNLKLDDPSKDCLELKQKNEEIDLKIKDIIFNQKSLARF